MAKIRLLPDEVSNQIAAGEVVERPASVVKELIENALDAEATRIDIAISQGGLTEMVVSDNGCGLAADDLLLAFSRHATSKLRQAADLFGISTLGFRGEALPSIASVAKVEVTTREASAVNGWQLSIAAGEQQPLKQCGAPVGTTIRVADLFFNTPARRQFMKSRVAEAGRIRDLVAQMALAAPQVAFSLKQDDRIVLETVGNDQLQDAILAIYGRDVVAQLIPVAGGGPLVGITGLISRPELTRNNRRDQIFILNNRLVQCRSLSVVLAEAYRSLLPSGRHPLAFLHLSLPPETVDVNVHPAKTEVRLREERQVAAILHRVLRQTLVAAAEQAAAASLPVERFRSPGSGETASKEAADADRQSYFPAPEEGAATRQQVPISLQQVKQQLFGSELAAPVWPTRPLPKASPELPSSRFLRQDQPPVPELIRETGEVPGNSAYRLLGQAQNAYIVIEREGGLCIVDQHAAHERIIYEQLSARQSEQVVQQLLVPFTLQLGSKEAAVLAESVDELATLGFDLEHFGGQTWLLRSLPAVYRVKFQPAEFMDLVSGLAEDYRTNRQLQRRERILIRLACQGAIKAGQRLHQAEMVELLDRLWQTELPFTCPHGRPTAIVFSESQLFRLFHP